MKLEQLISVLNKYQNLKLYFNNSYEGCTKNTIPEHLWDAKVLDILGREGFWNIAVEYRDGGFSIVPTDKVQYVNECGITPIQKGCANGILSYRTIIGNIHESEE